MATPAPASASASGRTPRIAIVCRDDAAGEEVTTFIAELGLDPVISQPPGPGASFDVLEALRGTDFALVLQADRQLEIGFLLAGVGRARMCVVQPEGGGDALPGISNFAMDDGGLWKLLLARHFKQAGVDVDLNKAM